MSHVTISDTFYFGAFPQSENVLIENSGMSKLFVKDHHNHVNADVKKKKCVVCLKKQWINTYNT